MRFVIAGAGAVGLYLGGKLYKAGEDVSLVARGPHLQAIREHGLRVLDLEEEFVASPIPTDDPSEIGPVDVVFIMIKAHSVASIAPRLAPPPEAGDGGGPVS